MGLTGRDQLVLSLSAAPFFILSKYIRKNICSIVPSSEHNLGRVYVIVPILN